MSENHDRCFSMLVLVVVLRARDREAESQGGRPRSPCEMRESLRQVERALGEVRKPKCQRMED
jgi:hypothetical protein